MMFNKTNKVKIRLLPVFIFVAVLTVSVKLNNIFDLYNNPAQKTLSISPAQALAEENQEVKQKYTQATRQISNLSQEKKNLNEKVTLASQLDATAITVLPKNKRGKTAKKVKDVKKIAVSFTIVKNITAKTGERTLYIRIAKPDNDVLTKNASNTFPYENRELTYSIKKYIEYTGEEQNVTVYWDVEEYLPAGTYHVYIFAEGTMIGQQAFSMK